MAEQQAAHKGGLKPAAAAGAVEGSSPCLMSTTTNVAPATMTAAANGEAYCCVKNDDCKPPASFLQHAVHQAMAFCADTQAYFQAVVQCPDVIERESPHGLFLEFCRHNVWGAAERLSYYWTIRLRLFGSEAAFLPLPLALKPEDWRFLFRGTGVLLPPSSRDDRSVFLLDRLRSLQIPPCILPCRFRCLFYAYHCMQKQSSEMVFMVRVSDPSFSAPKPPDAEGYSMFDLITEMTSKALCVKAPCAMHLIAVDEPNDSATRSFMRMAYARMLRTVSSWFHNVPTQVHSGPASQVVQSLQEATGMLSEHLPETVGGTWSYERDWYAWISKQFNSENGERYYNHQPAEAATPPTLGATHGDDAWLRESPSLASATLDQSISTAGSSSLPSSLPPSVQAPFEHHPVHETMVLTSNNEAYYRAVAMAPDLVARESPHDLFLQFEGGNVWDAAQRLASYWFERVMVLGEAHAFGPMANALARPEDCEFLQSRICTMLPVDEQGRSVFFIDRSKLAAEPTAEEVHTRQRFIFVAFHHMVMQQHATEFVLLLRIHNQRLSRFRSDSQLSHYFQLLTDTCMCLHRCAQVHLASVDPPQSASVLEKFLLRMYHRMSSWYRTMPFHFHMGSQTEVASSLRKAGIRHIPVDLGGAWTFDQAEWAQSIGNNSSGDCREASAKIMSFNLDLHPQLGSDTDFFEDADLPTGEAAGEPAIVAATNDASRNTDGLAMGGFFLHENSEVASAVACVTARGFSQHDVVPGTLINFSAAQKPEDFDCQAGPNLAAEETIDPVSALIASLSGLQEELDDAHEAAVAPAVSVKANSHCLQSRADQEKSCPARAGAPVEEEEEASISDYDPPKNEKDREIIKNVEALLEERNAIRRKKYNA